MKILALETTDQAGSVALLDGRRLVAEVRLPRQQRSAQSLAPAIRDVLQAATWRPADIRLVAVAIGPGSFTGLRVGLTTAKTFAYAVGCDLVAVPTLEIVAAQGAEEGTGAAGEGPGVRGQGAGLPTANAVAAQAGVDSQIRQEQLGQILAVRGQHVLAVLDAGRQQVFAARFRAVAGGVECVEPTALVDDGVWLARLHAASPGGELISGPGLRKFAGRLPAGSNLAAADSWDPRAATVGLLALGRHEAGQRDDPWTIVPMYHRLSAAEEKLNAR